MGKKTQTLSPRQLCQLPESPLYRASSKFGSGEGSCARPAGRSLPCLVPGRVLTSEVGAWKSLVPRASRSGRGASRS